MDVDPAKRIIRRRVHRARNALSETERAGAEARIAERLLALPTLDGAVTVCAYIPIRGEVGLGTVLDALRQRGVRIAYPRVEDDAKISVRAHEEGDPLEPGFRGIPEPGSPPLGWHEVGVALVPGVAFDRSGHRLGYGGGYFDRALAAFDGPKIGVAFACQIVDEIPVEPHDVSMDLVVTESEIIAPTGSNAG